MLKATRIRQAITTPALGVLLAGVFSLGAAGTAFAGDVGIMARPTGCSFEIPPGNWGSVARCTNHNGGDYRALVLCKDPDNGKVTDHYGGWRQIGFSYAYCNGDSNPISAGVETRV